MTTLSLIVYSQNPNYINVANDLGISHSFDSNTSGSGVSFVDFDGDGLDDITLGTNDNDVIHFYHNKGSHFERMDLGINLQENTKSLLWVDYDNDGDNDLYIAGYKSPNKLYQNQGNLNMIDVTVASGFSITDSLNTYGAVWGDYDRDGWLDVYYSERINSATDGSNRNRLFKNMADGTFSEVSETANVLDENRLPFCSAFVDMDNDKWPDIYIANDKKWRNTLLQNNGDGTYSDISESSGGGIEMDAMCVAPGDYNNDGKLDIYISNIADGGKLLTNVSDDSEINMIENAEESMVAFEGGIGWGSVFVDVDNDGFEDLYVSGSAVGTEGYSSQLFLNDGQSAFYKNENGFEGDTVRSFNNAIGDINNDGQMEIMVINSGGFNSQLWQSVPSERNWLKVDLEGVKSNKDGIGSWIKIYVGDEIQSRYTTCGNSFMGQNSKVIHFGIGNSEHIDSVKVIWPTGHIDKITNPTINQILEIAEGSTTNGNIYVDEELITPTQTVNVQFIKSQDAAGISTNYIQQTFNGGGGAWVDLDNDDDDDLYLVGGDKEDQIFINNGDGTFDELITNDLSITDSIYTTGVIYGDIDNDGDKDIFVNTFYSNTEEFCKNLLFINNGDLTFTESWEWDRDEDKSMTMGSVFLDYNLDGLLDIYTVSYVEVIQFTYDDNGMINGFDHECFSNRLYRNDGNLNFTDVTEEQGLGDTGCALAVTASDFDNDQDLDILLGNDFGPFLQANKLYQNDRESNTFIDQSQEVGANSEMFSMGIAVADYDNDLDLDYYISNLAANVLLENNNGVFTDVAGEANATSTYSIDDSTLAVSWGNLFADLDNDGDEDLFVANGYVPAPATLVNNSVLDPDRLFINNGDKTFTMVDTAVGIENSKPSRGAFYSDYDMDGDIDIFSVVFDKPNLGEINESILFENVTENENNWIGIKLQGTQVNRDAYGSKIYVHTPQSTYLRELSGGASFCSQHTSVLHIGIGEQESVDSVVVIWTGGHHEQIETDLPINAITTIIENQIVGINDYSIEDLYIYPNPTLGVINILTSDIATINQTFIIDSHGKRSPLSFKEGQNQITVDLINKSTGYYLIQIICENGKVYHNKILKI